MNTNTRILPGFIDRQNNKVDIISAEVREKIEANYSPCMGNPCYFSVLAKDRIGIVEEIYGAKRCRGKILIQKLVVIPENKTIRPIGRNVYYILTGMSAGFHSFGYTGQGLATNYECYGYADTFDALDDDFPVERIRRIQLFNSTDIAELDKDLKYNSYSARAEIYAIDYIPLYRKYPVVCETLMKLGIERMFTEKALETISNNKSLAIWLSKHHEEVKSMAFQTAFNSFKKNPNCDPNDYLNSLMYRIECGKLSSFSNKEVYKKVLIHTSQERIARYLKDNNIKKDVYGDYLIACDWLKLDFADTKVLFPKNFTEVHDAYTEQYSEYKREEERKKAELDFKTVSEQMQKVADKYSFLSEYKNDSYCVVIASGKLDLINESQALHHCVGKMDYDKRQAEEESIICFIRQVGYSDRPYVTTEVKLNDSRLSVVQCYGEGNRQAPEVKEFVKEWMSYSNKLYRKTA